MIDPAALDIDTLIARQRTGFTLEQPFYLRPDIYRLDIDRVLSRQWQYVDHVSQVEKPRREAIPVLDPAIAEVETGADDDLVAPGPHLLHLLQGGEGALRRAPAAALRRLGLDGPDVAVEHRLEALDDVTRVGEARPRRGG